MPTAIREQVLEALKDQIKTGLAGDGGSSVTVDRNRTSDVRAFPSVVVIDDDQVASRDNTGRVEYSITASVEGWVQADTDALLGGAMNDLYARVLKAAMSDPTLDGKAIDLTEGETLFEIWRGPSETPTGAFSMDLTIQSWTAEDDPFSQGPA